VFGAFHLANVIFYVVAGRFDILLFGLPFIAVHAAILAFVFGRRGLPDAGV